MLQRFVLLALLTLSTLGWSQTIEGNWRFESISADGNLLVPINPERDFMRLEAGEFTYQLEAKNNLQAAGYYDYADGILTFDYRQPADTIRRYKVSVKDDTLTLIEAGVHYRFLAQTSQESGL